VLNAAGCATYLAPAASSEDFLSAPFRTLAPEAKADVVVPAKSRRGLPALAMSGHARAGRASAPDLVLEKFTPPPASDGVVSGVTSSSSNGGLEAAALVEGALRLRGARFGTDGQVASLYTYMRREHALVPPRAARAGDVLFFAVAGPSCGDHTGVVESVDEIGRITFREARAGQVRTSYVHPGDPTARRWSDGRVVNSFLRPRRTDDPPSAKYFAGEMLCAVARVRR
jgi:hypothetical protein